MRPPRRRPQRRGSRGPLFFLVGVVLLLGAGLIVARPLAAGAAVGFAEDRPGALRNVAIRELVRGNLGDAVERAASEGSASRNFVVEKGDNAGSVARRLADEGLISRPIVFLLPLYEQGAEDSLQAGTYRVSAAMPPGELARLFQRAPGEQLTLRIIEGWRLSEIAAEVERRFPKIGAADFQRAAIAGRYAYAFLQDLRPGTPLEGYLFPETYFFASDVTAEEIVRTLLDTFQRRVGLLVVGAAERRRAHAADIVIVASIVEREARARVESPIIASVFWNRLSAKMALDADPTVQYALGAWRDLSLEDLKVESAYNTYRNPGLPPTPICSPGEAALRAAAEPASTDFLFFVAKNDGTGEHAFSRTLEEHEANRARYGNK